MDLCLPNVQRVSRKTLSMARDLKAEITVFAPRAALAWGSKKTGSGISSIISKILGGAGIMVTGTGSAQQRQPNSSLGSGGSPQSLTAPFRAAWLLRTFDLIALKSLILLARALNFLLIPGWPKRE